MAQDGQRRVLITGASSGIGRASAVFLAKHGFEVFAGVRNVLDADALRREHAGIVPVEIDVTDAASIARAADEVEARVGSRGLDGLVNNAGVGASAPVEHMDLEALRRMFEVNVFGPVAVTQAFLPLIRRAHGRIVNIGSVGTHMAMPFGGALCASKSALTMLSDALRLELHPFGIHVSLVEPAMVDTPAVDKTLGHVDADIAKLPPEGVIRYGSMLREFNRRAYAREKHGSRPEVVARAVHHALTANQPRLRYLVGKNAMAMAALSRLVPERVLDRILLRLFGLPEAFGGREAHGIA
jgi:NAD(P)-dependent dehydrogenase (short-subunit alcohol dehydrogenase family)